MKALWLVAAALGLVVTRPPTAMADDDLDLVKRAVAKAERSERAQPSPGARALTPRARRVKVRIVDKGTGRAELSVSLPLALVEVLDDWPIDVCPGHRIARHHRGCTLSEILAALQSGEDLVEIDSDDAKVRVWVE